MKFQLTTCLLVATATAVSNAASTYSSIAAFISTNNSQKQQYSSSLTMEGLRYHSSSSFYNSHSKRDRDRDSSIRLHLLSNPHPLDHSTTAEGGTLSYTSLLPSSWRCTSSHPHTNRRHQLGSLISLSSTKSPSSSSSSSSDQTVTKSQSQPQQPHKRQHNKKKYKLHTKNPKKQKIKTMFRQAKDMERGGQWRQACIQFQKILTIDPYDSYSHLALARLESRRERSGVQILSGNNDNDDNEDNSGVGAINGILHTRDEQVNGNVGTISSTTSSSSSSSSSHDNKVELRKNIIDSLSWLDERPVTNSWKKSTSTSASKVVPSKSSTTDHHQQHQHQQQQHTNPNPQITNHHQNNDNEEQKLTPQFIAQAKPYSKARETFYIGTQHCPDSIHIWQAWALHEQSIGNINYAKCLFHQALTLDPTNPYVCHGFGLLEQRCGNMDLAMELWDRPLKTKQRNKCTAALVCSLGKVLVSMRRYKEARELYTETVGRIKSEREVGEVYLAAAWLEEKHFRNVNRAEELLNKALKVSPGNSRAQVALARLEGRREEYRSNQEEDEKEKTSSSSSSSKRRRKDTSSTERQTNDKGDGIQRRNAVVKKRLKETCRKLAEEMKVEEGVNGKRKNESDNSSEVKDGRLFNAWADLEVKEGNYKEGLRILREGMQVFPCDQSLLQAAGKVEERAGNFTGARYWYSASLSLEPSAPTLVAYSMLEIRHPEGKKCNYTKVTKLFEEALLLDPRHGPVYNAYGNMELKRGNVEKARQIYENGVKAHCTDVASVYHGLAKLELSVGNVERARLVLVNGMKEIELHDGMMDTNQRKRAVFVAHTLGILELKCNRLAEAKAIFEKGIERHGNSSQLLLGAAATEVKLGNADTARRLFEQSVNADRKHAQAWQSWGVMEMQAGHYKIAKTLFEGGIKNNPNHGALWQAYATLESRRGNFEEARTLFAGGVVKCPTHVPLYQAWACLEIRGENYEKAKTLIGEALTRDKTQGSGWLVAAKIEEKLGNEGLFELILKRGIDCAPYSAELYCALAEFYTERGKIQAARELLETGLEMDPLHAPLYHSLAELEARVFNIEGLAQLNKRASQMFNTNALEPPDTSSSKVSMNLLRRKLSSKKSDSSRNGGKLPTGVAALTKMEEIEFNVDETITDMSPDRIINKMSQFDDDIVGSIFQVDDEENENDNHGGKKNRKRNKQSEEEQ